MYNHKEYQKEWKRKHPNYQKEWKRKHPNYHKDYLKRWRQKNKERWLKTKREETIAYREKYPQRYKTVGIANNKIKIPKGTLCIRCNKELAIEKHHPDYNKPLKVMFLCNNCHKEIHKIKKEGV